MSHSFTHLVYHLVFAMKERRPSIDESIEAKVYDLLKGLIRDQDGVPLEVNGMPDHVHIVARLPASRSISDILRVVKANSSSRISESIPGFAWQSGYGAFTVSRSGVEAVRRYIRNQKAHHAGRTYLDEFRLLLKAHGFEPSEADLRGE